MDIAENMTEWANCLYSEVPIAVGRDGLEKQTSAEELSAEELETAKFFQTVLWSMNMENPAPGAKASRQRSRKPCFETQFCMKEFGSDKEDLQNLKKLSSDEAQDEPDGAGDKIVCFKEMKELDLPLQTPQLFGDKTFEEREEIFHFVAARLDEIASDVEKNHKVYRMPTAQEILLCPNYESFSSAIGDAFGPDPGVPQLAMCFRLTRDIIKLALTPNICRAISWIRTYYRENMAPWVARQNGLESCVGPQQSEPSSSTLAVTE